MAFLLKQLKIVRYENALRKNNSMKRFLKFLYEEIFLFFLQKLGLMKYYYWYIIRLVVNKRYKKLIEQDYTQNVQGEHSRRVVFICDGKKMHGGLTDRIRGIVSTYLVCKELNIEFKILFIHPFDIRNYLVPNEVDWQIDEKDLIFDRSKTKVCFIDSFDESNFERKKQRKYMITIFNKSYQEFHVYTNASFSYDFNFSKAFNELFKPSKIVYEDLLIHKQKLGPKYIDITLRFQNLFGDFFERDYLPISPKEQSILLDRCIKQIKCIHNDYQDLKILVTSDSRTFLDEIKKMDFIYTIDGKLVHMDCNNDNSIELHKKSFVDFFMIANSDKIFLLKTGKMYNSGFPYSASRIYNKSFTLIEF